MSQNPEEQIAAVLPARIVPFGESAWLVSLGETIDIGVNRRAHAIAAAVRDARARGARWGTPAPGYASVLVPWDPLADRPEASLAALEQLVARTLEDPPADPAPEGPVLELPARYGGDHGPDLAFVAERTGLPEASVVELHASVTYHAFVLGFAPGFAYLGVLPAELEVSRRAEPRARVAPGSVAIAGRQTAVYPFATPGGWQLIGRTDERLWDLRHDPPARIRPGSRVRFVPVRG